MVRIRCKKSAVKSWRELEYLIGETGYTTRQAEPDIQTRGIRFNGGERIKADEENNCKPAVRLLENERKEGQE